MKKGQTIIATTIAISIGGILAMLLWGTNTKEPLTPIQSETKKSENKALPTQTIITQALKPISSTKEIKKEHKPIYFIKEDVKIDNAFESVDIDTMKYEIPHKKGVEPIAAFTYKPGTIKTLRKGDSIILPEINNIKYELKVTKTKLNQDGSKTVTANIDGGNSVNFALLTEGKNTAFMTLNSPEGVYQVEIFNGKGYVYNSRDIAHAYIDYSKSDEVYPPHTEAHHSH